jgi:hypothetical protein
MTKPKSTTKAATRSASRKSSKSKSSKRPAPASSKQVARPGTKHDRIIAMLRTPVGATIASMPSQQNGISIRCAAFLPVWFARISFPSKPTRVGYITSRMAKLRLPLRTGANRRPDAMQKKRRNGHASTKTSC